MLKCVLVLIFFIGWATALQVEPIATVPAKSNQTVFTLNCKVNTLIIDITASLPVTYSLTTSGTVITTAKSITKFQWDQKVPKGSKLVVINDNGSPVDVKGILYSVCKNNVVMTVILCIVIVFAMIIGVSLTVYLTQKYPHCHSNYGKNIDV